MKIDEAYTRILDLTSQINESGIGDKLINASRTGRVSQIEKEFNIFKLENRELWKAIKAFDVEYQANKVKVFKDMNSTNKQLKEFDTELINPVDMFMLILFIGASDRDLFEESNVLAYALKNTGNEELSQYVFGEWIIGRMVDTLWNAFYKED